MTHEAVSEAHQLAAENALRQGDFSQLIRVFLDCLRHQPNNPFLHNDLAKAYLKIGNRQAAKNHFIEALHLDPHHVETLCQLALFYRQEGDFVGSIRFFKKALRVNPIISNTHYQLANTYAMQNQFELALTHYHEALQYGGPLTDIHRNLGMIYFGENQWEKASHHLTRAFDAEPDTLIGLPLGQALLNLGQAQEAERTYEKILTFDPNCHDAHHNLAILRLNAEDRISAKRHFEMAHALQPNNATAQHMLNALSQSTQVTSTPLAYTQALFDQYAPYYDQHMRKLGYNLPLLIRNLLGEVIPTHAENLTVLDLGCGTGSCGLYCRDLAHCLIGVDLSHNMLSAAKTFGAYDKLIESPLQSYLQTTTDTADIVIAAEVFNYIGDLSMLWPDIIKILKPGGVFIFSTEHAKTSSSPPANNPGCQLEQTGRFTHDPAVIQMQIEANPELHIRQFSDITLRKSNNNPIMGRLWCLIKGEKDTALHYA
jgi:predicted TPR repeat methyltransferase